MRSGHNVTLGYLSQHAEELGTSGTVLDAIQRATGLTPGKARALLGRFLFSGEEVEKPLDGLSGGERRRLSLAILVSSGANVLILDEPTNHLDLDAREALEDALSAFDGTVLLVSHDRALLDAVGTRTIALEDGRAAQLRGRLGRVLARARGAPPGRGGGARAGARRAGARAERPQRDGGREKAAGPSKNQLAPHRGPRAQRRARREGARGDRGRARRPLAVAEPHEPGALDRAPRRGEARRRAGVRGLGRGDPLAQSSRLGRPRVMR